MLVLAHTVGLQHFGGLGPGGATARSTGLRLGPLAYGLGLNHIFIYTDSRAKLGQAGHAGPRSYKFI